MQTRDDVEGLHNCREFSQRLECLYEAMQTQEKSIKREILTSRKVLSTKSCTRNQFLFRKKLLSKIRIFLA